LAKLTENTKKDSVRGEKKLQALVEGNDDKRISNLEGFRPVREKGSQGPSNAGRVKKSRRVNIKRGR